MQTLSEQLGSIELKVRQLALRLERLQNENKTLLQENTALKTELDKKENKLSQIEQKVAKTQVALDEKREDDPGRSKKLRKEIEQYINEVDKCIEWLQKS